MHTQATAALHRLLDEGRYRLVLLRWPSQDIVGAYDIADVKEATWADNTEDPYVAIATIDETDQ
jgi:hypothetical protein